MMIRSIGGSLALALIAGFAWAQDAPKAPTKVPEAPAMGGKPSAMPSPAVIGLRSNEVAFSRLRKAAVESAKTDSIGTTTQDLLYSGQGKVPTNPSLGTIEDLRIDTHQGKATAAVIKRRKDPQHSVDIDFSSLRVKSEPHPSFTTLQAPQELASKPATKSVNGSSNLRLASSLVGRDVQVENGGPGGRLTDLVVELRTGTIDYAVIQSATSQPPGIGNLPHAVPWSDIKVAAANQPLTVTLDQAQLDQAPAFGAVAQERREDRDVGRKTGATLPPE